MIAELIEDGTQNRLATQVGWPAFKRARRLKCTTCSGSKCRNNLEEPRSRPQRTRASGTTFAKLSFCDISMSLSSGHQRSGATKALERREAGLSRVGTRLRLATYNIRPSKSAWSCATLKTIATSLILILALVAIFNDHFNLNHQLTPQRQGTWRSLSFGAVECSLIIGDSAIEIQEVDDNNNNQAAQNDQQQRANQEQDQQQQQQQQQQQSSQPQPGFNSRPDQFDSSNVVLGTAGGAYQQQQIGSGQPVTTEQQSADQQAQFDGESSNGQPKRAGADMSRLPSGPLPPLSKQTDDVTDGDKKSRGNHDYDLNELAAVGTTDGAEKLALNDVLLGTRRPPEADDNPSALGKTITGKVVDFELQSAGGHNKAKIKKKKKKKMDEEMFKKWGKKKKMEKKAMEKKEAKHMKKKKEEGKKGKKKWGIEKHGQKKKGTFKKKKWGKKVKKGKGVKKGKKGKKFLKDKGHKNTAFRTVYHKEEWGKSSKWHDIKREKKWDEKSKKYKKKWKKEKGKDYKGDHMKKFEKKKKEGKQYKKAKKEKYKKFKKEEFEKGKKKKMEEHKKKKEGGAKKEEKKMEKKKKKKKP